jgi:hypothetical protein
MTSDLKKFKGFLAHFNENITLYSRPQLPKRNADSYSGVFTPGCALQESERPSDPPAVF